MLSVKRLGGCLYALGSVEGGRALPDTQPAGDKLRLPETQSRINNGIAMKLKRAYSPVEIQNMKFLSM